MTGEGLHVHLEMWPLGRVENILTEAFSETFSKKLRKFSNMDIWQMTHFC